MSLPPDASAPTNRLAAETSPYLQQHARNPVDWFPWGPEALAKARELDRPIFLSIGYSACHWCHVMERESFEDEATAAVLNANFVNIKVDREERPDLDQIYMSAVQMMTGGGGWPMSVWLTPDLEPFYGGTYFPPAPRYNMPAFRDVCTALADAWRSRRAEIVERSGFLAEKVREAGGVERSDGALSVDLIVNGANVVSQLFDRVHGGLGRAPKFPHSVEFRLLLRAGARAGIADWRDVVLFSLEKMIRGGIYDQLGGGFHRYSTDAKWLVPHFEKMLYDNALVGLACLEAFQVSRRPIFRDAAAGTLDYILREMTSPEGPFYSAQDADSEGEEGKFFVWTPAELESALGPERARIFGKAYDVTPRGNWEGRSILNLPRPLAEVAGELAISLEELSATLAACRAELLAVRSKRIAPMTDEKILVAWNGMAIEALAVGTQVLGDPRYAVAAARAADYLLANLRTPQGRLLRTARGGRAKLDAYLEDYAYLANGLVSLYEADFNPRWLVEAEALADVMLARFWDPAEGGFFFTADDHEALIARNKDPQDGAIPSGNAMAATALVRLALFTGRSDLSEKAEQTFRLFRGLMADAPHAAAQLLIALSMHLGPTDEVAIVAEVNSAAGAETLRILHDRYRPDKIVALAGPRDVAEAGKRIPLLAGKTAGSEGARVYLCRNFACAAPLDGSEAFRQTWHDEAN